MKKSLNAWTVAADTGFADMFAEVKDAGFDGIELNLDGPDASAHALTLDTDRAMLDDIARLSRQYGLPVVSVSTSLYAGLLGSADPEQRRAGQRVLEKQLVCAEALGAGGILIVPGGDNERSLQKAYDYSYQSIHELEKTIDRYQINVGVENVWNGFFSSPFDMASFIDRFDSPYIGAYYDVGNVIAFSWSECWIEVLGSRIRNVHVKDFKRNVGPFPLHGGGEFVDLLEGDVNWPKVVPALRAAGFDGYLTAEVFKADERQSDFDYYRSVAEAIGKILAL